MSLHDFSNFCGKTGGFKDLAAGQKPLWAKSFSRPKTLRVANYIGTSPPR